MPCCVICKKNSDTGEIRSFHRFPSRNKELREKWLKCLELTSIRKEDRVCCDHFHPNSFLKSLRSNRQVRLNVDAVPELTNYHNASYPTVHYDQSSLIAPSHNETGSPVAQAYDDSFVRASEVSDADTSREKQSSEGHSSAGAQKEPTTSQKYYRFPSESGMLCLNENSFSSPEVWKQFQEYMNAQKKLKYAEHVSKTRAKKTKEELQRIIKDLEANTNINLASYLEGLPVYLQALVVRIKNRARPNQKYPESLRILANTIHFHSPKAYLVLRKMLNDELPSPSAIREWGSSTDYKPGILHDLINYKGDIVAKHAASNHKLYFTLTFDEVNIREQMDWCPFKNEWKGLVDLAGQLPEKDKTNVAAKETLVFMLVSLNSSFKAPVAHYLIDSLNGDDKSTLIKDLLIRLQKSNIQVLSMTFDGDPAHIRACSLLGAQFNINKPGFKSFIDHPITSDPIYIFWDACHMLKLLRNYFEARLIYTKVNNTRQEVIDWKYIRELSQVQFAKKVHFSCKVKNWHVYFHNEKMKVFLAAQTCSFSTAKAMEYLRLNDPLYKEKFKDSKGTENFCLIVNDAFDILNVRTKYSSVPWRNAITKNTLPNLKLNVEEIINYIRSLELDVKLKKKRNSAKKTTEAVETGSSTVNISNRGNSYDSNIINENFLADDLDFPENCLELFSNEIGNENECMNKDQPEQIVRKSVLDCSETKTGFLGFIINLLNLYSLASVLLLQENVEFLLTYKLSQDHVELFLSLLRSMNGYNNNPTTTQYLTSMRKILIHDMKVLLLGTGNCIPQDNTSMISKRLPLNDKNSVANVMNCDKKYTTEDSCNGKSKDKDFNLTSESFKENKSSKKKKKVMPNPFPVHQYLGDPIMNDHDYGKSMLDIDQSIKDIVMHTAGFVLSSLKIDCDDCIQILRANVTKKSNLTQLKDWGGLVYSCDEVNYMLICCERVIRHYNENFMLSKDINSMILKDTLAKLPRDILSDIKLHNDDSDPSFDHRYKVIYKILQKFINVRMLHESDKLKDFKKKNADAQ